MFQLQPFRQQAQRFSSRGSPVTADDSFENLLRYVSLYPVSAGAGRGRHVRVSNHDVKVITAAAPAHQQVLVTAGHVQHRTGGVGAQPESPLRLQPRSDRSWGAAPPAM
jgi:hypothetical protein